MEHYCLSLTYACVTFAGLLYTTLMGIYAEEPILIGKIIMYVLFLLLVAWFIIDLRSIRRQQKSQNIWADREGERKRNFTWNTKSQTNLIELRENTFDEYLITDCNKSSSFSFLRCSSYHFVFFFVFYPETLQFLMTQCNLHRFSPFFFSFIRRTKTKQ